MNKKDALFSGRPIHGSTREPGPDPVRASTNRPIEDANSLVEQLRLSEKRLNEAQHLARMGNWELDLVKNHLMWSDEVYRIFEIPADEFENTYEAFMAFVHPDDRDMLHREYQHALKIRQPYVLEHRLLLSGGKVKYVEERCDTYYDDNGDPIRSFGTVQDITDKRLTELKLQQMQAQLLAAEQALHAKEERFKQIADSTQTVIWEVDVNGLYTFVSPIVEKLLGYHPEDLVGKCHFFDLHPVHGRDAFAAEAFSYFSKAAIISDMVNEVLHADGSVVTVVTNGQPILNSSGALVGYRGSDQDITERLRAQIALKRSNEMLTKLAMHVPGTLYQFQVFPDGRSCLPYVSHRVLEMYGLTAEQVREDASVVFAIYHPEDVARIMQLIATSAQNLTLLQAEYRVRLPGRPLAWHYATAMPERMSDGSTMWHGIATNIDNHKLAENNLREQEQKLRSLLAVREEQHKRLINFTHIVSHNLRSHTSNMEGLMSLLEMDEPQIYDHEYIQMVARSSQMLSETINHLNQVLDIRLNTDSQITSVCLSSVIDGVLFSFRQAAKAAGIRVIKEVSEGIYVQGVKSYLENTIMNLVSNAIKFRSDARDSFLRITLKREGKEVVLSVEDNGLGINMDRHANKLFGMYKTFHTVPDSNGLGLFITKNQLEAMSARIEVHSQVDMGSVFTVYLSPG